MTASMSQQLSASIALCTFNGSRFLREQLQSYCSQTLLPGELVVCDDASSDDTLDILNRFADKAPFPVRIHCNRHRLGHLMNFERTLSLCSGDIVFFSDQDDVWEPCKIKSMTEIFSRSPDIGLVFSDASVVDENLRPIGKSLWKVVHMTDARLRQIEVGHAAETILKNFSMHGMVLAFRSNLRGILLPFPEKTIHDIWVMLILPFVSNVGFTPELLVKYRRHSDTATIGWDPLSNKIQKLRDRKGIRNRLKLLGQSDFILKAHKRIAEAPNVINKESKLKLLLAASEHYRRRAALPANRVARSFFILREFLALGYQRYSHPVRGPVKDILMQL